MIIGWILFVAALAAGVQGALFRKWGHRAIRYERFFSAAACYPGEEIELVERISNRKPLPVPWLRLESLIHANLRFQKQFNLDISGGTLFQNHRSLFSLMPYRQITRRHKITALARGCYRLNTATLTLGDALGLSSKAVRLSLQAELLVYPRPVNPEEIPVPSRSWQGDRPVRRWIVEDPFLIAGVREYRSGDPLKGVNWKASARTGRLQVHQYDYTAQDRLMIYLNVEDHDKMWHQVNDEALFERGIEWAAALAGQALEQGTEAGFGTNAYSVDTPKEPVKIEPGSGGGQWSLLQETMAKLVVARSIPFDTFLEQEAENGLGRQDIVILSAYMSEKMKPPVERLRANGNSVVWVPLMPPIEDLEEHRTSKEANG
ncbi:DUF58 domain-containing protein [Paenibacillus filicis]|uniref:DUF58 domain-containing protein n=1 Tax=Paenibacillus gyeongsangnamensis TaxID=3388067 RepID=A0ABT4Q9Y8_9BACL|nr:DUF58 domain-containing protein [Paenibacillus filicis]MCZ8513490.1 DUF58 domain-containing protein [Paenibacillus filicis]